MVVVGAIALIAGLEAAGRAQGTAPLQAAAQAMGIASLSSLEFREIDPFTRSVKQQAPPSPGRDRCCGASRWTSTSARPPGARRWTGPISTGARHLAGFAPSR